MKYYVELKKCPVTCAGCQFFSERNICGGGDDYIRFVCKGDEKVKKLMASDKKPKNCPIKENKIMGDKREGTLKEIYEAHQEIQKYMDEERKKETTNVPVGFIYGTTKCSVCGKQIRPKRNFYRITFGLYGNEHPQSSVEGLYDMCRKCFKEVCIMFDNLRESKEKENEQKEN